MSGYLTSTSLQLVLGRHGCHQQRLYHFLKIKMSLLRIAVYVLKKMITIKLVLRIASFV